MLVLLYISACKVCHVAQCKAQVLFGLMGASVIYNPAAPDGWDISHPYKLRFVGLRHASTCLWEVACCR